MPNDSSKTKINKQLDRFQAELNKAQAFHRIWKHKDVQDYLVPHLKSQVGNKWLDPLTFPNKEEFYRAYVQYRAKAQVFAELLNFLGGQEDLILALQKRIKDPTKSYKI